MKLKKKQKRVKWFERKKNIYKYQTKKGLNILINK